MGYTQLSHLKRFSVTERRRQLRVDAPHTGGREEAPPSRFVCPSCDDGSIVAEECPRCGVPMIVGAGGVILREGSSAAQPTTGHSTTLVGLALAALLAIPGGFLMAGWSHGATTGTSAWMIHAGVGLVLVMMAIVAAWRRFETLGERLAERRVEAARRRRRERATAGPLASCRSARLTRARARVALLDDGGDRIALADGEETAVVELGPRVRVYGPDGERRDYLHAGDEVEVVGEAGADEEALRFGAERPVEIWVRS